MKKLEVLQLYQRILQTKIMDCSSKKKAVRFSKVVQNQAQEEDFLEPKDQVPPIEIQQLQSKYNIIKINFSFGFGRPPTGATGAQNRHSSAHQNNPNNINLFHDANSSTGGGNKNRDHSIGDINSQGGGIKSLFKDDPLLKPLAGVGSRGGDATPKSNIGSNIGGIGFTLGLNNNSILGGLGA